LATTTESRLTTYDDYRHLPDDGTQYQIIKGRLYMTPAPTTIHQRILLNLIRVLDPFVENNNLGEILIAPVDVVLSMTDVVQPDLVFVAKEILSEHTKTIDRQNKMELYEKYDVNEYWIVDPDANTIEQFIREKETFELQATVKDQQELTSQVIDGLSFPVNEVLNS